MKSLWFALSTVLLLSSCQRADPVFHRQDYAFGTVVEISIFGIAENRARQISDMVLEDMQLMHKTWHAWQPGSLSRVNALLVMQGNFSIPPSILPLIRKGEQYWRSSQGLFNPAIGKLIALWGFHKDIDPEALWLPPRPEEVAELVRQNPVMGDVVIQGIEGRGTNSALHLDFGGFAKGYMADQAVALLREQGVENAIVNIGGDLRAIGTRGERPWHIGIRHPRQPGVLASLDIRGDECVFTSGDYERFYQFEGKRYHHIIDPRSGYPAQGLTSVTVLAQEGALADAAATALFIAGPQGWPEIARSMGVSMVMVVDDRGQIEMTPAMAERLKIEVQPAPTVKLRPLP